MVWTCHGERPGVCSKKGSGNGVTGKEEKRGAKKKISGYSEGGYGKLGAREKEVGNRTLWRSIIRCGNPPIKGKG